MNREGTRMSTTPTGTATVTERPSTAPPIGTLLARALPTPPHSQPAAPPPPTPFRVSPFMFRVSPSPPPAPKFNYKKPKMLAILLEKPHFLQTPLAIFPEIPHFLSQPLAIFPQKPQFLSQTKRPTPFIVHRSTFIVPPFRIPHFPPRPPRAPLPPQSPTT